jgi:hypothetical protein
MQMKLWNEELDPKVLVYTWEPNYRPGQIDTTSTLCKAIATIVSITEPVVGPPQAVHQSRLRPSPFCFLVARLTQTAADILIEKQYWSLPSVTFFAIPYTPHIPVYLQH